MTASSNWHKFVLSIFTLSTLLFFSSNNSYAGNTGAYFTGFGGVALLEASEIDAFGVPTGIEVRTNLGWDAGGEIGYDAGVFRLGFEMAFQNNSLDEITGVSPNISVDGDIYALSYMLKAYLDLENSSAFTPYFGGGVGFSTLFFDDPDNIGGPFDNDQTLLAFKISVGTAYEMTPKLHLLLGYDMFATESMESNDKSLAGGFLSHNLNVGARFYF